MEEFEAALLNISENNLNATYKKHNDIDNKAIGIITISGLLITFLTSSFTSRKSCASSILLFLTLLLFLITVYFCVVVLKPRKAHEPSTLKLIEQLKNEEKKVQISRILQTHAEIEDELQNICTDKASELHKAVTTLGISVILLILYNIITFF
jgi:Ca2+/Na+ antiporter